MCKKDPESNFGFLKMHDESPDSGDKVLFEEKEGVITLTPMNNDIEALAGSLANDTNGKQATLEDTEEAIKTGATASWLDDERDDNGRN
ncbi:hypothetical protein [uncultured Endozoicomonas sp.]|uniref:hypothetical protein n=1 Tax=uncultured Endozoicomonas sp. TaxID=432652 RepID=UPI0026231ED5|nr:hypothetical protein [uncultured Endozoicomonas sp.]